jgi:glutathione S-transferase
VEVRRDLTVRPNPPSRTKRVFLPALWLFGIFVSPVWGPVIGFLWILARIHYACGYYRDATSRGPGFIVGMISNLCLLIGSIGGMLHAL